MGYLVSFCGWLLICSFALLRKTMLTCCSLLKNVPAMGFKIRFLSDTHRNHKSFLQLETIQWSLIFPCYTFHRFGRGTHHMKRFVKICALSCSSCQRINKGTHWILSGLVSITNEVRCLFSHVNASFASKTSKEVDKRNVKMKQTKHTGARFSHLSLTVWLHKSLNLHCIFLITSFMDGYTELQKAQRSMFPVCVCVCTCLNIFVMTKNCHYTCGDHQ